MITSTICKYFHDAYFRVCAKDPCANPSTLCDKIHEGEKELRNHKGSIPHEVVSYTLYDRNGEPIAHVTERGRLFFHAALAVNKCFGRYYGGIDACKHTRYGTVQCLHLDGLVRARDLSEALEQRKPGWRR